MKKILKHVFTLVLIFTVFFTATPVYAIKVVTDTQQPSSLPVSVTAPAKQTLTLYPTKDKRNSQAVILANRKATSLKSSNTKVLTVSQKKSGTSMNIYATLKKAGTATVSCKINGKTYQTRITVRKYVCPVSYVKINTLTLKSQKFKSTSIATVNNASYKNKLVKFAVKPASGWKITGKYPFLDIVYTKKYSDISLPGFIGNNSSFIANGDSGSYIEVTLQNTKTSQKETVKIVFK